MRYFMGIDNGGTFSKAALFDENGNQIAVASIFVPVITPKSGYTERDMETLWQANVQVIREVVIRSKVSADKIAGISFSGHGKGLYMELKQESLYTMVSYLQIQEHGSL